MLYRLLMAKTDCAVVYLGGKRHGKETPREEVTKEHLLKIDKQIRRTTYVLMYPACKTTTLNKIVQLQYTRNRYLVAETV